MRMRTGYATGATGVRADRTRAGLGPSPLPVGVEGQSDAATIPVLPDATGVLPSPDVRDLSDLRDKAADDPLGDSRRRSTE